MPKAMSAVRTVDIDQLLAQRMPLAKISGVGRAGWAAGSEFEFGEDGSWSTTIGGLPDLEAASTEALVLDTPIGALHINTPFAESSSSDFSLTRVVGRATSFRLVPTDAPTDSAKLTRIYVRCPKLRDRVELPECIRDPNRGFIGVGWLPLALRGGDVDVLWLQQETCLVVESAAHDVVTPHDAWTSLRPILAYLLGVPLNGEHQVVHLDERERVLCIEWYPGHPDTSPTYPPLPLSVVDWMGARETLGLSETRPIDPAVFTTVIDAYQRRPELEITVEYLLRFAEAPVEVRGVLLSVALESLTHILVKLGIGAVSKPFSPTRWDPFLAACEVAVGSQDSWSEEEKDTVRARLRSLNTPTNATKLLAPFSALGVELTDDEVQAVKSRNRLLHVGRYLDHHRFRDAPEAWRKPFAAEMRLYTALNKLLLTHLGYRGPIIDWGQTPIDHSKCGVSYSVIGE